MRNLLRNEKTIRVTLW